MWASEWERQKAQQKIESGEMHETRFGPIAQSYAKLGTMLATNTLFCWYPIYHWSTYTDPDPRDGGVLLVGLVIALFTWLFAPAVLLQGWRYTRSSDRSQLHRAAFVVLALGIYSPGWIVVDRLT